MSTPEYFLNISPEEMARANLAGAMTLQHPAVRAMHNSLEAFIAKLHRESGAPELIKALRPNILVTGETGTGKELVSKALWLRLVREKVLDSAEEYFGIINCACLPADLLEIELFGTTKVAFTGAGNSLGIVSRLAGYKDIEPKKGLKGSPTTRPSLLFLDEIGAAGREVQAKLLRLVENREFSPLGLAGRHYQAPYLMILAATNELYDAKLEDGVGHGDTPTEMKGSVSSCPRDSAVGVERFRLDLFYRLCDTFHFHLPALRERKDEIALIAAQFYQKYYRLLIDPQAAPQFPEELGNLLLKSQWPGNGRQLHQILRRAMILWDGASTERLVELVRGLVG